MAIISSIPGLEVWVNVDGKPAAEYDDPNNEVQGMDHDHFDVPPGHDSQPPCVIKYIEVKHGAPFSFHYLGKSSVTKSGQAVRSKYWIDGAKVIADYETQHDAVRRAPVTTIRAGYSGNRTDGYQRYSFIFSPLEIAETGQVSTKDAKVVKDCGILRVVFFHTGKKHMSSVAEYDIRRDDGDGGDSRSHSTVAEKALKGKAVDCKTTYIPSTAPTRRSVKLYSDHYIDARKRPFAVFEFRYRSKEGLIKEGIIPRPGVKEEIENMTDAEVRQRLAELMEEQNQRSLGRVKREDSLEVTSGRKTENSGRIKREAPSMAEDEFLVRYKTRRLDNGRVAVDLTDD
ncbi:hypothetical protein B0I37DRAFT_358732 [Chaetomium sp. MPI-CAGE-AT-0009]|nr:hypothetical protein B0I37DRAFT_358732 [Chaetomium sp. MPI-CAGE-AT-0009]